jgi:signal transduction histidine kinase
MVESSAPPGDSFAGSDDHAHRRRLRRIHSAAAMAAAEWILATAAGTVWLSDRALDGYVAEAVAAAERDANGTAAVIERTFHALASLSQVMARQREVRETAARYSDEAFAALPKAARTSRVMNDQQALEIGDFMVSIVANLGYDLVYVLNRQGITVVSSDWRAPATILGESYADRAYFVEAMQTGSGRLFAVGRNTGVPAFFFGARIATERGPAGVVVVRQDTAAMVPILADGRNVALIVDDAGMIVGASDPKYFLRHAGSLSPGMPNAEALRAVYRVERPAQLAVERPTTARHGRERRVDGRPYLVHERSLDEARYRLLLLDPLDWLAPLGRLHAAIGVLAALAGLLAAILADRIAAQLERRRHTAARTTALNRQLAVANEEKNRFLGIASHDLRSPLSSVRGLSQLMLSAPIAEQDRQEFLETIHRTSDEMLGLVNDLLDVAVIESGKLDLRCARVELGELVQQRLRHFEPQARAKTIALETRLEPALFAMLDRGRFAQVIDNLVGNALKFSPAGSTVQVNLRRDGQALELSVDDQGPGIAPQDRALLFRSFQQLSARPTGGEKSTGLGLAIVKRIVDAHGGDIQVLDGNGGGARFLVSIPALTDEERN